ncbi:hypothetical protein MB46_07400 [Arthrobacter alpinus]|nr:hypothetical protein MB46_07400 [Arthrobacter alpinus]
MKTEIRLPYSEDNFTVETEMIPALHDLLIVRISVGEFRIALTPKEAKDLGHALLDASLQRP